MCRGRHLAIVICLAACMVGHDEGIHASPSQGRRKEMGCLPSGQKLAASGASARGCEGSRATTASTAAAANLSSIALNVKKRTRRIEGPENEKQPEVAENATLPRRVRRARVRKPVEEGGDGDWGGNNKGELSRLEDFRKFVQLLGLRSRTTDQEIDSCFAKAANGTLGVLNFTECASAVGRLASSLGIHHILPTHWGPNVRAIPVWRLLRMAPRRKGSWGERRWNRPCMDADCTKLPSFGVFGTASPEFCRTHAPPGYLDLRSAFCQHDGGCQKHASFCDPATRKKLFCAKHAPSNFVSSNKFCRCPEGCSKQAAFGEPDGLPRFCGEHRADSHVLLKKRMCRYPEGCSRQPVFGEAGGGVASYCEAHKLPSHVNVVRKVKRGEGKRDGRLDKSDKEVGFKRVVGKGRNARGKQREGVGKSPGGVMVKMGASTVKGRKKPVVIKAGEGNKTATCARASESK